MIRRGQINVDILITAPAGTIHLKSERPPLSFFHLNGYAHHHMRCSNLSDNFLECRLDLVMLGGLGGVLITHLW